MDKLIKKGQLGTPLYKEIHLQKDPGEEYQPTIHDSTLWMPELYPKARMDATVQQLTDALSTYKPTPDQTAESTGIKHKMKWYDWIPSAVTTLPFVAAAAATAPEWGPAALTTVSNPAFWGELIKDTGTYIAADAASQGLTGKGIGAHVNNAMGLEEEHPVGEFIGFGGARMLRKAVSKQILKLFEEKYFGNIEDYIAKEVSNSLKSTADDVGGYTVKTWYGTKFYQNNGKIRLRLSRHTKTNPQELVLEPCGKDKLGVNQWRLHIRIPNTGRMPDAERDDLLQILYEEFPEYSVIIPPESSIEEPVKRGAVAAYRWISRDPSFVIGKTNPKPVIYPGRNKYREVTIFHPIAKYIQGSDEANKVFQNALKQGKEIVENYIGSENQIQQLISTGATEETARAVAQDMRNNLKLVTSFSSNPTMKPGNGVCSPDIIDNTLSPSIEVGEPESVLDLQPTIDAIVHEYGGHAPTLAATNANFSPEGLQFIEKFFPRFSEVKAHNSALKPERIPILRDETKLPIETENQIEYLEDVEEYAARTRSERMGSTSEMQGYNIGFTTESVDRLRKLIWSIMPFTFLKIDKNNKQNE